MKEDKTLPDRWKTSKIMHPGKPKGSGIKTKDQMAIEYRSVIKNLKAGQSIRNTSKITGVSPATVQKVKKEFNL